MIITKLEQYDYEGATAVASVMLIVSFALLLVINGLQAWTTVSDLVLNSRDLASADAAVHNTLAERQRLYQAFQDARRRFEEAAG